MVIEGHFHLIAREKTQEEYNDPANFLRTLGGGNGVERCAGDGFCE